MIGLLAIGVAAGILLGLRFRVLVLVPATLVAAGAVAVTGLAVGHRLGVVALAVLGTVALLQIGYVVGCVIQAASPLRLPKRTASYTNADTEPI